MKTKTRHERGRLALHVSPPPSKRKTEQPSRPLDQNPSKGLIMHQDTHSAHHWRDDALCRRYDPEGWFPVGTTGPAVEQSINVKRICQICPSVEPCRSTALADLSLSGIWGATDHDERKQFVREARQPVPAC